MGLTNMEKWRKIGIYTYPFLSDTFVCKIIGGVR